MQNLRRRCCSKYCCYRTKSLLILVVLITATICLTTTRHSLLPPTLGSIIQEEHFTAVPQASPPMGKIKKNHGAEDLKHGYLLTLRYAGQQTMASCALLTQQCWLSSFSLPIHLVEPFLRESHLSHSAQLWSSPTTDRLRFRDFFDLGFFNRKSMQTNSSVLKSWEDFVQNAPRDIIAVTISKIHGKNCIASTQNSSFNCQGGSMERAERNKFTSKCVKEQQMKQAIKYLVDNHNFRLAREVCFNCRRTFPSHGFSPKFFTEHILGNYRPSDVTIIVNTWKYSVVMSQKCKPSPKCHNCHHFLVKNNNGLTQLIQPSRRVKKEANYYAREVLHYSSALEIPVALMLRVEWMPINEKSFQRAFSCFSLLLDEFKRVNKTAAGMPFVAMDIGRFGSDSFNITYRTRKFSHAEEVMRKARDLIPSIYSNKWTFSEWEESFEVLGRRGSVGGKLSKGYVAAVQRELASRAKCLITMGGGHFQKLALDYHAKLHSRNQCVHRIDGCGYNPWEKE